MNKVVLGSALDKLRELPSESVHCMVTSPPYWSLRAYSTTPQIWGGDKNCKHEFGSDNIQKTRTKHGPNAQCGNTLRGVSGTEINQGCFCSLCGAWRGELGLEPNPELYISHLVEIMREVKRVLRDDGIIWIVIGDSYARSGGWSDNSGLDGLRRGESGRAKSNIMAGCNGQKCPATLKEKDLVGIPWMLAFALRADGWWLRSDITWSKPNPMPESVTDRPTKSHEYIFLFSKSKKYFYDADAIREKYHYDGRKDTLTKGSTKYKDGEFLPDQNPHTFHARGHERWPNGLDGGRNKRSVWNINTQPYPDAHFAVFPTEIPRLCISAGTSEEGCCSKCGAPHERITEKDRYPTRPGIESKVFGTTPMEHGNRDPERHETDVKTVGWRATCNCNAKTVPCTVLDPFAGSGTTGEVAKRLGRNSVLIELNPEYKTLIEKRLRGVSFGEGYHSRGSTPDVNKSIEEFV